MLRIIIAWTENRLILGAMVDVLKSKMCEGEGFSLVIFWFDVRLRWTFDLLLSCQMPRSIVGSASQVNLSLAHITLKLR